MCQLKEKSDVLYEDSTTLQKVEDATLGEDDTTTCLPLRLLSGGTNMNFP